MPAVKKTVKKAAVKTPVKKTVKPVVKVEKKAVAAKVVKTEKISSTLSVALFDASGKELKKITLPEVVFGSKINEPLMAQAVRVYLANQRMGSAVAKTRGQVDGSTRKIYRQKGTGRARHGGIRAPIFVGGGTAHGPKLRDYSLDLPTKMKKAAVASALSAMAKNGKVVAIAGFTELQPKTKLAAKAFAGMGLASKKALLVMPEYTEKVFRAVRNIDRMAVSNAKSLTTYDVLNAGTVVVMQESIAVLEKMFEKKESK